MVIFRRRTAQLILALVLVLALTLVTAALAAGPLAGATYKGEATHGKENAYKISLKVAASGKTVKVTVNPPPIPCDVGVPVDAIITKAAAISKGGSFTQSITYVFNPEPAVPVKLVFAGKFSGKSVAGTMKNETGGECDATWKFSAKAK